MKKLLSVILSITMLLSIQATTFADDAVTLTETSNTKNVIKVGVTADFAPFEYYENDVLTGFDIDLMNCIGERTGYNIEYINIPFDSLIPAILSGRIDCAVSAITATEERDSVVDFTKPYLSANVKYKEGDTITEAFEQYAVVFRDGVSDTILKSSSPTDYEKLFILVNGTIEELISDGTIEKLVDKYDLNKPYDDEADYGYGYYEYMVLNSTVTDAKEALEKSQSETADNSPSEWAAKDIDFSHAIGITDNTKQYNYKNNITREEFCELIYNLVALINPDIEYFIPDSFTDTKNYKVLKLNSLGIINGKTSTKFAPDDFLTREESATIIIRMINKIAPMPSTEVLFMYDDINEISDWASNSVQVISNLGFMNGIGNNKFAPKDAYTTEQAIATLVRVYKEAEKMRTVDGNSDIGIIGGADGPTSIIVGDNVNIVEKEEYNTFLENVSKNQAKVDDFYIKEAINLVTESGKLAGDKEFISYYTSDEEILTNISELSSIDYSKPSQLYYMDADYEKIIGNLEEMYGEDAEGLNIEKLLKLNKISFAILPNLINASYGTKSLAAFTMLTNNKGYIMPESFKNNFALYLEYDGGCSALVTFSEYGDGVISANMSFVINGEKDNIFRRIFEITQALGEDTIKFLKVK